MFRQVRQMSESHCGPAVLEMLLSHLNIATTQDEITHFARVEHRIEEHGTSVLDLARAVRYGFPQVQFWYKDHARVEDLETLVHDFHYPVGVEWQGLFYDTAEEEEEAVDQGATADFGHYAVVKHIDREQDIILVTDPYHSFANQDRFFDLSWFVERWWDDNEISANGYTRFVRDSRMMFIVTPKGTYFPKLLGMVAG